MQGISAEKNLDVAAAYRGKTLLLAGASGFLGKVFLTLLLDKLPEVRKVYVLLRARRLRSPCDRFEQMLNKSFVFSGLHERFGAGLSAYVAGKVEMVEGDIGLPHLGLDPAVRARLLDDVDLFVNSAGLVDFNPDLRDALAVNVEGTLHGARFVRAARKAKLLHVSTCFVSGRTDGEIAEEIRVGVSPTGRAFSPRQEYDDVRAWIAAQAESTDDSLEGRRAVRDRMIDEGMRRASALGWTNTYTYSKALSEQLLKEDFAGLPFAVLRPSIVESAAQYPFPGWNEGFNTCGPLAHLLGTWFRYLPAKPGNPFDVIPVDQVAKSMVLVGAELLDGTQREVYQCASSGRNVVTIDQAAEWTSLSHRIYYGRQGQGFWQRWVRPYWGVRCVGAGLPWLRAVNIARACRALAARFGRWQWTGAAAKFERYAKKWTQIANLLELFRPFIHDQRQFYRTDHLCAIRPTPAEFAFDPRSWDWRTYWLDVHMPGLRRWCFPVIRREAVKSLDPVHPFRWPHAAPARADERRPAAEGVE